MPAYIGQFGIIYTQIITKPATRTSTLNTDWPWVGARGDVAELRDRVEPDPGVVERDEADVVVPDDLLGQDLGMTFYASDNLTSLTFIEVILDKLTHLNMSSVLTAELFES